VQLDGDAAIIQTLQDVLVEFSSNFEILPGTIPAKQTQTSDRDLCKQPEPSSSAGG
jgi:hypothetical protein